MVTFHFSASMLMLRHYNALTRRPYHHKVLAMAETRNEQPVETYKSRCRGVLLWKACADTLGAALEGLRSDQVLTEFPNGVIRYAHTGRPFGRYTDDTQMALSLAVSLVAVGKLDAGHVSMKYAQDFEPERGYGQTAAKLLAELKAGVANWRTVARQFFPEGSFANGGAMRIAPLGLAYRHAAPEVLHSAVRDALLCTHVHPEAVDGAVAIAAATAWLSKQQLPECAVREAGLKQLIWSPEQQHFVQQLLSEVQSHVQTEVLRDRLTHLGKMLQVKPPAQSSSVVPRGTNVSLTELESSWVRYLHSPEWQEETAQAWQLSDAEFQIRAVDAVPMVLYAFCRHALSEQPAHCVLAACHYGGDADTVAAMAGALVGALYGDRMLPALWLEELENDHPLGRDGIIRIADNLAALDVR